MEKNLVEHRDPGTLKEFIAVVRLFDYLRALKVIFDPAEPPLVLLRPKRIISVVYGFGDAFGTGLGASFICATGFAFRV